MACRSQRTAPARAPATLLLLAVLSAGCAAPGAADRFYALHGPLPADAAPREYPAGGSVGVGPVRIPELLDRPQLVRRVGEHQVALDAASRWAADLDLQVTRVLALQLATLLPEARVQRYPWDPGLEPERQLVLDLLTLEVGPAPEARLAAQWGVVTPRGRAPLASGRVELREPVTGAGAAAEVAALDRLLGRLAVRLARELAAVAAP